MCRVAGQRGRAGDRRPFARSGTSPGANYRAACRARTGPLFVDKLGIAEEEMDESGYWLDLILAAGMLPATRVEPLLAESVELTHMLSASRQTARRNLDRLRAASRGPVCPGGQDPR